MPRVNYKCKRCPLSIKKFYKKSKDIKKTIECECGGELVRQLSSPTQKSTMVIDNGVQAKATELNTDIVEIIEDREKAQLTQRGDAVLENLK